MYIWLNNIRGSNVR